MIFSNHYLSQLSSSNIGLCSVKNYNDVVSALNKALNLKLTRYCDVKKVSHSEEISLIISTIHSSVSLGECEEPRSAMKKTNDSTNLLDYSYADLKAKASCSSGMYRGRFWGSVLNHTCPVTMDCPDCNGSGICSNCKGSKQVTCPVCNGSKECPDCNGTGRYSCRNCNGSGQCPDCDGDGWVDCEDCDGTGTYVEDCRDCNGTGWYRENVRCRSCGGTGEFEKECWTCGGSGRVDCDTCDGSGDCYRCKGKGYVKCKACAPDSSGTCGKCKGRGKIWCPSCQGKGMCFDCKGEKIVKCSRCDGSGVYQTVKDYFLIEQSSRSEYSSLSKKIEHIESISGTTLFNDVVYDFFAKKGNVFKLDEIQSLVSSKTHKHLISDWLNLKKIIPSIADGTSDDYLNLRAKLTIYPSTKIVFSCRGEEYPIWIVGNNNCIYYDCLPKFSDKFVGFWSKLF